MDGAPPAGTVIGDHKLEVPPIAEFGYLTLVCDGKTLSASFKLAPQGKPTTIADTVSLNLKTGQLTVNGVGNSAAPPAKPTAPNKPAKPTPPTKPAAPAKPVKGAGKKVAPVKKAGKTNPPAKKAAKPAPKKSAKPPAKKAVAKKGPPKKSAKR
jgi:outer membrane biosynthesis protein TonB